MIPSSTHLLLNFVQIPGLVLLIPLSIMCFLRIKNYFKAIFIVIILSFIHSLITSGVYRIPISKNICTQIGLTTENCTVVPEEDQVYVVIQRDSKKLYSYDLFKKEFSRSNHTSNKEYLYFTLNNPSEQTLLDRIHLSSSNDDLIRFESSQKEYADVANKFINYDKDQVKDRFNKREAL